MYRDDKLLRICPCIPGHSQLVLEWMTDLNSVSERICAVGKMERPRGEAHSTHSCCFESHFRSLEPLTTANMGLSEKFPPSIN